MKKAEILYKPCVIAVAYFYRVFVRENMLFIMAMGTEDTEGNMQKEDNLGRQVGIAKNDVESGRRESKGRTKKKIKKYQHPRLSSLFLHPVVCLLY